jgi:hypothetical protein
MLDIIEAAKQLGYSPKGLRKIVDRSRAKARGAETRGPTIKFFQAGTRGSIKFRPEWLETFIAENTIDPQAVRCEPAAPRKPRRAPGKIGHGFDR